MQEFSSDMPALSKELDKNIEFLKQHLQTERNFDIVYRVLNISSRKCVLFFIDGFTKDEILEKIIEFFMKQVEEPFPQNAHEFSKLYLPYGEISQVTDFETITTKLLSGISILLVDGYDTALEIDCRTYPARGVSEPEKDKVLRGSRDGFVETLVFNTALIRRRIRDPRLCMQVVTVGSTSKTDIVLSYMSERVDEKLLKFVMNRLQNIKVDALTMNQQSLAECLYNYKWINPFPKFKYTERPDTAAAHILEGNIIILVDNSPSAMILPTSVFDIIEEADDYYFPPLTGTYLRLTRFFIAIVTVLLPSLFLVLVRNPTLIPAPFAFIIPKDPVNIPLFWQFILLEVAVDGMRLAAVNTPSMLSTPFSVMAALVLGDFSVSSGWFNSEPMLYMAFVSVATYTQPNYELGYAMKFLRIMLLILTALWNIWGFGIGVLLSVLIVVFNKTISGTSYLYPILPFSLSGIARRFFRHRLEHEVQ